MRTCDFAHFRCQTKGIFPRGSCVLRNGDGNWLKDVGRGDVAMNTAEIRETIIQDAIRFGKNGGIFWQRSPLQRDTCRSCQTSSKWPFLRCDQYQRETVPYRPPFGIPIF